MQDPQSTQSSGSIRYCPDASAIASTGQLPAHEPHDTHASLIEYAMKSTSIICIVINLCVCYGVYFIMFFLKINTKVTCMGALQKVVAES